MTPSPPTNLTILERFFRLFTDVRPGEGRTALLMFINIFLILCAYYFIKPLREGWISVSEISGLTKMEVKAYSSFGQGLLLVFIVRAYGRWSSRWRGSALITRSTLFCMSNMVIFWFLQPGFFLANLPSAGVAFYLWVGMFGVFVVAQFFAFAADLYEESTGKRLIPLIMIGATAGAVAGSWITEVLVSSGWVATEWLLIAALVPLGASIGLTRAVDRDRPTRPLAQAENPAPQAKHSGIQIVFSSRFLLAAAGMTLLLSWANTNGENLLFRVVQETLQVEASQQGIQAAEPLLYFTRDRTTLFYSDLYFWVNVVTLTLQAFVASRLLKYGGFGSLLLLTPLVALVAYSAMAILPVLAIVRLMKIADNAADYSINNTARHVLWLPVSPELKYKGKTVVDTFFVRLGDGLAALTALVGVKALAWATQSFFILNIGVVLLWLTFAILLVREHRRLTSYTDENAQV